MSSYLIFLERHTKGARQIKCIDLSQRKPSLMDMSFVQVYDYYKIMPFPLKLSSPGYPTFSPSSDFTLLLNNAQVNFYLAEISFCICKIERKVYFVHIFRRVKYKPK